MPVIDPYGLFHGQRLAACSDLAQLYWPRLFCAANTFARLELHLPSIINQCFSTFQQPPSEAAVWSVFQEYSTHYLALAYRANGRIWVQFMTEEKYLKRHKSQDDQRTPAPSDRDLSDYKTRYHEWKKRQAQSDSPKTLTNLSEVFQTSFASFSSEVGQGIGVGIGDGVGEGEGRGVGKPDAGASLSPTSGDSLSSVSPAAEANGKIVATVEEQLSLDAFFDVYDKHHGDMRPCRDRTKKRKDCLRSRIRNGLTLTRWSFGVAEGATTPFCCGKNSRNQAWTIDDLLDENKFAKLMEGKYRDAKSPKRMTPSVTGLKALGERHG